MRSSGQFVRTKWGQASFFSRKAGWSVGLQVCPQGMKPIHVPARPCWCFNFPLDLKLLSAAPDVLPPPPRSRVPPRTSARAAFSPPWSSCAPRGPPRASSSSASGRDSGHHSGSPHDCPSSTHLCIVGAPAHRGRPWTVPVDRTSAHRWRCRREQQRVCGGSDEMKRKGPGRNEERGVPQRGPFPSRIQASEYTS
ncbi:hypothetical protein DFH06DRAFT_1472943 [Mycena polygramma]|nr:hypothetical protein DFH06DRAFT_1472943 [Mycena polygramma]